MVIRACSLEGECHDMLPTWTKLATRMCDPTA